MKIENLVEKFQCVGCVAGCNINCGQYKLKEVSLGKASYFACSSHVPGTSCFTASGFNKLNLGLPKGFCRIGEGKVEIRIHPSFPELLWDKLNIPVWAMVEDNVLFVRTYAPRINKTSVDIIPNGNIEQIPNIPTPINVAEFISEID